MWYVIQVKTGEENGIARRLKIRQSEPRFLLRTVPSGLVGHGQKGIYSVPGYVFLDMDFTARNYYRVKEVPE